jgi:hypothetical protein
MRLAATSLVLAALATPAAAQGRGSLALDVMTTQGRHLGVGYYVSDGLSLRPSLGAGYSSQYGFSVDAGLDLRWELMPANRFSPYATAGLSYRYDEAFVQYSAAGAPLATPDSGLLRYGAGLGWRARMTPKLSVVGEGRVTNGAIRTGLSRSGYPVSSFDSGAHFEAALGVSYVFN